MCQMGFLTLSWRPATTIDKKIKLFLLDANFLSLPLSPHLTIKQIRTVFIEFVAFFLTKKLVSFKLYFAEPDIGLPQPLIRRLTKLGARNTIDKLFLITNHWTMNFNLFFCLLSLELTRKSMELGFVVIRRTHRRPLYLTQLQLKTHILLPIDPRAFLWQDFSRIFFDQNRGLRGHHGALEVALNFIQQLLLANKLIFRNRGYFRQLGRRDTVSLNRLRANLLVVVLFYFLGGLGEDGAPADWTHAAQVTHTCCSRILVTIFQA